MSEELACSTEMREYFQSLTRGCDECYAVARRARGRGKDPEVSIEIPQAEDLASRVEKLLADWDVEGVADDIRRLTAEYGNRELVSLIIAKEIATRPAKNKEWALDRAIRVGLAVLTEGILVAPLEGIASIKIGANKDGTDYLAIVFAGPIRAAGGTGQAMSVLIGDVVRRELGIGHYVPMREEVQRFHEEVPLYKQCQHLQYSPSASEIELIVENCPVCIDGEGTENVEISGYRDLPRIETNKVRGGAVLVLAEGLCQKAAKIQKHVSRLKIDGWGFIDEFLGRKKSSADDEEGENMKVKPDYKYLKDIVAGRPIFGHPSRVGGLRLRYGRGRTCGLAAIALNPATMYALDEFPALGTQIKIERPGKAGAVTPCDSIEGPILLLNNGDLVYCQTSEEVLAVRESIAEIIDTGEILIPFGEFSENNHLLVPAGYCLEWHQQEILQKVQELPLDWRNPSWSSALIMSRELAVPLHPCFNLFWSDVPLADLVVLREHLLNHSSMDQNELVLNNWKNVKLTLETLGALHIVRENKLRLDHYSLPLLNGLGLGTDGQKIVTQSELVGETSLQAVSQAMGFEVRARGMTRIGSRMARPEKAKERKMNPPVHSLFPINMEGGAQRLLATAITASKDTKMDASGKRSKEGLTLEVGVRRCTSCEKTNYRSWCTECGAHTVIMKESMAFDQRSKTVVDLAEAYADALQNLGISDAPAVKCVQAMTSKHKVPEALEKGILRAIHDVFVFKDGTMRFDMTDVPVTHFRPGEIGLSVEKAIELGYRTDMHGEALKDPHQLCELKVQDFLPSENCGDYMVRVAMFIDDLLRLHYGLDPFYNIRNRDELIGHLGIGLAPHTSGGILCRIIGFTKAAAGYAHPFFHAAKRRNCDGDEDSIILLMDGLINFSRSFLPDRRGGLMDAPLVLTTRLDPNEVDKEAHNVDCLSQYPLELYQAAAEFKHPREIEKIMDMVGGRIGSLMQYEGLGFTHDTEDISAGPKRSAYTTLDSMMDKTDAQFELGRKIRAVDVRDVVTRVINKHFLPDMAGNLRSFSAQSVRCTKCGEKYRRIPLSGRCSCGNTLILTVHEASVKKYLEVSKRMGEKYGLSDYTQQRIEVLEMSMNSLFNNDKIKKCKLSDFM